MKKGFLTLIFAAASLVGCSTPTYKDAQTDSDLIQLQLEEMSADLVTQVYQRTDRWYFTKANKERAGMPDWCYKRNSIGLVREMPLNLALQKLTRGLGLNHYFAEDEGVIPQKRVSINSNTDVCDGLQKLSLASGYSFEINDQLISFRALKEEVVPVHFMPGVTDYFLGKEKGAATSSQTNSAQVLDTSSAMLTDSPSYKNVSARLNAWQRLASVLEQLKSPEKGFVGINQVASNVLLRDTPDRVNVMKRYIERLNNDVSQVIAVDVTFLEFSSNRGTLNELNWQNLVKEINSRGHMLGLNTDFASSLFTDDKPAFLDYTITNPTGDDKSLLVQALEQQGTVAVKRRAQVITMHNQVAKAKDVVDDTYLASSKTTSTSNVGSEAELLPGKTSSGADIYILARSFGQNVQLHMSTNISNLLSIGEVKSNESLIQTPREAKREFDTMALIPEGKTLLLSGIQTDSTSTDNESAVDESFGVLSKILGFSKGARRENRQTMILINARVIYRGDQGNG